MTKVKRYVVEIPLGPHDRMLLKKTRCGIVGYPYPKDIVIDTSHPSYGIDATIIERQFPYLWEYTTEYQPAPPQTPIGNRQPNGLYTVQLGDDLWLGYRAVDKTWHHVDSTFRSHYQTIFNNTELKNIAPSYRQYIKPLDDLLGS